MLNTLKNYIYNIEDAQANFDLALEYDKLGQSYTAISYYLRAANFTDDDTLAYTCLLKMATWFIPNICCFEEPGSGSVFRLWIRK